MKKSYEQTCLAMYSFGVGENVNGLLKCCLGRMRLSWAIGVTSLLFCGVLTAGSLPLAVNGQALPSLAPMLDQVTPAVVNISTRARVRQRNALLDDPFFRQFFDIPETPSRTQPQSLGSGVIVDRELGLVVTNNHVIENASEILVTLSDAREFQAELIGADPEADIALIKIAADNLTHLVWANSDALRVGDFCVAIGNPFGLGQTVTSGIVSALGRSGLGIEAFEDFIQTDASINPGNSGGALVDLNGKLIGINTAIVGPSGGNVGIGFAIPANMAVDIIDQLRVHGKVQRGALGIVAQELTPALAQAFGVDARYGVVIGRIREGSPADKAGLRVGDVITAIDGRPVRDINAVKNRIGLVRLGQRLSLTVIRETTPIIIEATIEQLQDDEDYFDGVELSEQTSRNGRGYIWIESIEPGALLDQNGLQAGDIILSINRQYTETLNALERLTEAAGDKLLLLIQRGQATQYVQLEK